MSSQHCYYRQTLLLFHTTGVHAIGSLNNRILHGSGVSLTSDYFVWFPEGTREDRVQTFRLERSKLWLLVASGVCAGRW